MDYKADIINPGDLFSKMARRACLASFKNSPAMSVRVGSGTFRTMDVVSWSGPVLQAMLDGRIGWSVQSDGAGSKPAFFTLLSDLVAFRQLIWEIITMNIDDYACRGGLPVGVASSNIDFKQLTEENWPYARALYETVQEILKQAHLVLLTGETAIMPHSITAFCDVSSPKQLILTWNATCFGLNAISNEPIQNTIRDGMTVIGIKDNGYRCNGGSKFADIILQKWGPNIGKILNDPDAMAFIAKLTVPSQSYGQTIARLNGWKLDGSCNKPLAKLHGVAHITGGGLWGKFGEILPPGVGAKLNLMVKPTAVLPEAQELSAQIGKPMSGYECLETFHGGCGMILVCEASDVSRVLHEFRADGHAPYLIGGTIRSEKSEITVNSHFAGRPVLSSLEPH